MVERALRDPCFTPFVEHPEKYRGRRVLVEWHSVSRNIPEAGGQIQIEEATLIRLLAPKP